MTQGPGPSYVAVKNLSVAYGGGSRWKRVVNDVSFTVERSQSLVILGESGSGKSVTLRSLLGLPLDEGARIGGEIRVGDVNVLQADRQGLQNLRGRQVGLIFQEPMVAFDPVFRIGAQIAETVVTHAGCSWRQAETKTRELLELVQIPSARERMRAYPHELSGGLRQRAMIAMALSCDPELLLADEPTTALDATVQIQILLLLKQLQREREMSMVFVTHDLGVAAMVADRIAVMHDGRLIESGAPEDILKDPSQNYTKTLLSSVVSGRYFDPDNKPANHNAPHQVKP